MHIRYVYVHRTPNDVGRLPINYDRLKMLAKQAYVSDAVVVILYAVLLLYKRVREEQTLNHCSNDTTEGSSLKH